MLPVAVQAPSFDSPRVGLVPARSGLPKVTAVSTLDGDLVRAILINKDAGGAATVTLEINDSGASAGGTYTSFGGAELFSTTAGVVRQGALEVTQAGLRAVLPPHSVTLVEIPLLRTGKRT
jgi:hypothetical protein